MPRTRIKICGLTRSEDVDAAVLAGADALGFVFYPPSRRALRQAEALQLMLRVPPFVTKVALFVNAARDEVLAALASLPIDLLQFHGDEPPEYCGSFNCPWIKAARMAAGFDLLEFSSRYRQSPGATGILADAHVDGFGGAGKTFDWRQIPKHLPLPLVLSGGLNPQNIEIAIDSVRPWAVDVSSGVEVSPTESGGRNGIKSVQRIEAFIAGVRNADARIGNTAT